MFLFYFVRRESLCPKVFSVLSRSDDICHDIHIHDYDYTIHTDILIFVHLLTPIRDPPDYKVQTKS